MLDQDIELRAALLLDDTDEGGGAMSGTVIEGGAVGNLGITVADLDRTTGRVFLRKVFPHVDTPNRDTYYRTTLILSDPPDDANVFACLFSTGDFFDQRSGARDRLERYLAPSVRWPGRVLETQLEGQRSVKLLLGLQDELPDIGATLYLVQDEGTGAQVEQYIRVLDVASEERSFTVTEGSSIVTFRGLLVTLTLSEPLRHTFIGLAPGRVDDEAARAVLRDTIVADAAKYLGCAPLAVAGAVNDFHVDVETIFTPLVPASESETPFTDLTAAGERQSLIAAGSDVIFTTAVNLGAGLNLYLGNPCTPGSLSIAVAGGTITDSRGALYYAGTEIGSINYSSGQCTFGSVSPSFSGSKTVTFTPAGAPLRVADSASIPVTLETRGYTYTITLKPLPARGTLIVSYRALGKWYDLRDQGNGELVGARPAYGSGYLSPSTGTLTLTLGALPDVDTAIVLVWGTGVMHVERSGVLNAAEFRHDVGHAILPNTLTIAWISGGSGYSVSDNGNGGLTGHGGGTVDYGAGRIMVRFTSLPPVGTNLSISYQGGTQRTFTVTSPSLSSGLATLQLLPNITPGSLTVEFPVELAAADFADLCDDAQVPVEWRLGVDQAFANVVVNDTGGGGWKDSIGGTINYSTGQITIRPSVTRSVRVPKVVLNTAMNPARPVFGGFDLVSHTVQLPTAGGVITVRYTTDTTAATVTDSVDLTALALPLNPAYGERLLAGSLLLRLGTFDYRDAQGVLLRNLDRSVGTADTAGSINYAAAETTITAWAAGTNSAYLLSALAELSSEAQPVEGITFRIPTAPVRTGSVQIRGTTATGTAWQVTAGNDGAIAQAPYVTGSVDYQTGLVTLRFGQWVTAAGNENQPWYDPALVSGNQVFHARPVLADSIRYNAVALTYLPMSADRIGVDPVRLPQNGQVPIFRSGDVLVVHHTGETAVPNPVTPGMVVSAGRTRLSRVRVVDSQGAEIAAGSSTFSANLDAGTVTFAASGLNLGAAVQPLKVIHRIEDEALATDVDLSGRISLNKPLSHVFPEGSLVSSALEMGDLRARAYNLFTQGTWTGAWSDDRIGDNPALQFDTGSYSITVTNEAAITERWALVFTSATQYRVLGEHLGQIAQGIAISQNFSPTNPVTGLPYFTIPAGAFGLGGSVGNVMRFNTQAAAAPAWVAVTVLPGATGTVSEDSLELYIRGNGA